MSASTDLTSTDEPLRLELRGLSKTFPGTRALDDVALELRAGEVHALVGQNGSGKSTLIKILSGFHPADHSAHLEAFLDGEPLDLSGRAAERSHKLRFVHQGLGLVDAMDALDNIAISVGYGGASRWRVDWKRQREHTRELLSRFDLDFDVHQPMSECTEVERTAVAVVRAIAGWEADSRGILVLDEPTAALRANEVDALFAIVNEVKSQGVSVLYVSHRLGEIFRIADRATFLREGRSVATREIVSLTTDGIIELMIGEKPAASPQIDSVDLSKQPLALEVRNLVGDTVQAVSFAVRCGEIVGFAGLAGSGRDELPHLLIGDIELNAGDVELNGQLVTDLSPATIARHGIGFVPADRQREGAILPFSIRENVTLTSSGMAGAGRFSHAKDRRVASSWVSQLKVKARGVDDDFTHLSGGNQQKVVMAKALATEPAVLLLDEPTVGVDVGARAAIYDVIRDRASTGLGVVVFSSDNAELIELCSRILVVSNGELVAELAGDEISEARILASMNVS